MIFLTAEALQFPGFEEIESRARGPLRTAIDNRENGLYS